VSRYAETLDWLFAQLPVFQRTGGQNYKIDLAKTWAFMEALGHPERSFKSIHIGGTNGKGSTSHMVASCLQEAGYRVGLYTSPHLVDYRERIRLNGQPCSEDFVVDFVERWKPTLQALELSFFEMSVGMAFVYFRDIAVDVAVVEVGMGGRLDSTNVLLPVVAAVTNIDLDHQAFLGTTRAAIAAEKAGIFKPGAPALVGEHHPETEAVFTAAARAVGAPLTFVEDLQLPHTPCDLLGSYQRKNQALARAILAAQSDFEVSEADIARGLLHVATQTGLQGRWQVVSEAPFTVLDTAHNVHGLTETMAQFRAQGSGAMHLVFGMVGDKDAAGALALLPTDATYYFCAPSIPRALAAEQLHSLAAGEGLNGNVYPSVHAAWEAAKAAAGQGDRIYVGGSTFVVADALTPRSAS